MNKKGYHKEYYRTHKEQMAKTRRIYRKKHSICTTKNGKSFRIYGVNKRPNPGYCELCGRSRKKDGDRLRLQYHHWDNEHPSRGLWLCIACHWSVEAFERGFFNKYMELKEKIELSLI